MSRRRRKQRGQHTGGSPSDNSDAPTAPTPQEAPPPEVAASEEEHSLGDAPGTEDEPAEAEAPATDDALDAEPEAADTPAMEEAPPPESVPTGDGIFSGNRLRQHREAKGISLKEISDKTKISLGTLAALEEERYEDMPNARVYVRGFVRCLAEELGLDQDEVSKTYVPRWERWFDERVWQ